MAQTPNVIGNLVIQRLRELEMPATPENYERLYYEVSGLRWPAAAAPTTSGPPAQSEAQAPIDYKELLATLRELLSEVSEKTAILSKNLGEKNQDLQTSVSHLQGSREKKEILRLLSQIVSQAGNIHSTVEISHSELLDTRRALENIQMELSETRQMLHEDPLTGTLNRRGLDQYLEREVTRSHRTGEHLSLAMLDLDHFKRVNDKHGHEAGDQMLVHFSSLLKSVMRKTDAVVRYGGEEFVVLFPETDMRGAMFVLARLQQLFSKTPLAYGHLTIHATFSAGIASLKADENGHALLRRADAALYDAKNAGRNCLKLAA